MWSSYIYSQLITPLRVLFFYFFILFYFIFKQFYLQDDHLQYLQY